MLHTESTQRTKQNNSSLAIISQVMEKTKIQLLASRMMMIEQVIETCFNEKNLTQMETQEYSI